MRLLEIFSWCWLGMAIIDAYNPAGVPNALQQSIYCLVIFAIHRLLIIECHLKRVAKGDRNG